MAACGTEQMHAPIARAGRREVAEAIAGGRSEVLDLFVGVGVRIVFSSAAKAEDSELSEEWTPKKHGSCPIEEDADWVVPAR